MLRTIQTEFAIVSNQGTSQPLLQSSQGRLLRSSSKNTALNKEGESAQALTLDMAIDVECNFPRQKQVHLNFYHPTIPQLLSTWLDKLIGFIKQCDVEQRKVEAVITHEGILLRKRQNRRKTNNDVMGENARQAFMRVFNQLTDAEIDSIVPQWCHLIMSSGLPLEANMADNPLNLCCAPEGLNRAMRTPEHMVAKVAEFLYKSDQGVKVTVNVELLRGTSILRAMRYEILTPEIKMVTFFDHPFRQPHTQYDYASIPHLEEILEVKIEEGGRKRLNNGS